jgi:hypothetical protein
MKIKITENQLNKIKDFILEAKKNLGNIVNTPPPAQIQKVIEMIIEKLEHDKMITIVSRLNKEATLENIGETNNTFNLKVVKDEGGIFQGNKNVFLTLHQDVNNKPDETYKLNKNIFKSGDVMFRMRRFNVIFKTPNQRALLLNDVFFKPSSLKPTKQPAQQQPAQQQPAQQQPAQQQPAQQQPAQQQPAQKEPAQKEPAQKEPAQQEPAQKEPAQKEPAQQEPAQKEPAQQNNNLIDAQKIINLVNSDKKLKNAFYQEPTLMNSILSFLKGEKPEGTGIIVAKKILQKYFVDDLMKKLGENYYYFNQNKELTYKVIYEPIELKIEKPITLEINTKRKAIVESKGDYNEKNIILRGNTAGKNFYIEILDINKNYDNAYDVQIKPSRKSTYENISKGIIQCISEKNTGYYNNPEKKKINK